MRLDKLIGKCPASVQFVLVGGKLSHVVTFIEINRDPEYKLGHILRTMEIGGRKGTYLADLQVVEINNDIRRD